jgi:ubiquinone/menaquinone biosynthesis C-methylase UbiE
MTTAPENLAQEQYWNEPGGMAWTQWQQQMDTQLAPLGNVAIEALALHPGERVLDVGCGCGHTTLQVAELVGSTGSVVGLDISAPMVDRAIARAAEAQLSNATFFVADAQTIGVEAIANHVDAVISRFGVMFFADPKVAFANIAAMTKPGGRLSFVCWQTPQNNPWMAALGRELAAVFPDQAAVDPNAPGPFAFADPERTRALVEAAGWTSVEVEPCTRPMQLYGTDDFATAVEGSLRVGGAGRLLLNATDEQRAATRVVADRVMRSFWGDGGAVVEGSCWLVTAKKLSSEASPSQ